MEQSTILLVDDNPQILAIMAGLLKPLGYSVVSALSGAAALTLAAAHPPDLILLDVMMPEQDGFAVTRAIREHPLLAQVPVILVTALDDRASRVRGFEAGADDFVTKPFDYAELRARVATILRLNRYRRLLDEQARVAAERTRFVWAVEQSTDGVLILGPDDRPRYANPRARQLLNLAPEAPLDAPFLNLVMRSYSLTPAEFWVNWPADPPEAGERYLVRPVSPTAAEAWLRVELLPPSAGDDARVVSLRDVTVEMKTQREIWTFHAVISHKLRTPLVGILGGLNLLGGAAQNMERESVTRIVGITLDSARRLRDEIEDILNYLRPPSDPYGNETVTIAEAAALATQLTAELTISSVSVAYEQTVAAQPIAITRASLEVVLREIFENAIKFHPQRQPAVGLAITREADCVTLRVSDDGPGLDPELLTLAWRPYYQGERSFTGQIEGMGLGLALVARIVYALGGRCELANNAGARGATVILTLPLGGIESKPLSRPLEPRLPPSPSRAVPEE